MPWDSAAQSAMMHSKGKPASFPASKVKEFDAATDFKSLPKRKGKSKKYETMRKAIRG